MDTPDTKLHEKKTANRRHLSPRALALDTTLTPEERTRLLLERARHARQQQVATGEGMAGDGGTELAEIESALDLLGGVPESATPTRAGSQPVMPDFSKHVACPPSPEPQRTADVSGGGLPCSRGRWSRAALPATVVLTTAALAAIVLTSDLPAAVLYPLATVLLLPTALGVGLLALHFLSRRGL